MAEVVCDTYAVALFETAVEESLQNIIYDELLQVLELFKENTDYFNIFLSPAIKNEDKKEMIKEVFKNEVNPYLLNFLYVIADNNRFSSFEGIVESYNKLLLEKENIMDVTAVTAIKLTDELYSKLENKLSLMFDKKVRLKNEVDKSIIGGVKLRYDNKEIDNSVKSRLDDLKKNIKSLNI